VISAPGASAAINPVPVSQRKLAASATARKIAKKMVKSSWRSVGAGEVAPAARRGASQRGGAIASAAESRGDYVEWRRTSAASLKKSGGGSLASVASLFAA